MMTSRCLLQTTTRRLPPAQASAALQQAEQRRKEQGRPSVPQGLCLKDVKALNGKTPLSGRSKFAASFFLGQLMLCKKALSHLELVDTGPCLLPFPSQHSKHQAEHRDMWALAGTCDACRTSLITSIEGKHRWSDDCALSAPAALDLQQRKLGFLNFTQAAGMEPQLVVVHYLVAAVDPQDAVSRWACSASPACSACSLSALRLWLEAHAACMHLAPPSLPLCLVSSDVNKEWLACLPPADAGMGCAVCTGTCLLCNLRCPDHPKPRQAHVP